MWIPRRGGVALCRGCEVRKGLTGVPLGDLATQGPGYHGKSSGGRFFCVSGLPFFCGPGTPIFGAGGYQGIWVAGSTVLAFGVRRLRLRVPLPLLWLSYRQMTCVLASVSVPPLLWGSMWSTSALLGLPEYS